MAGNPGVVTRSYDVNNLIWNRFISCIVNCVGDDLNTIIKFLIFNPALIVVVDIYRNRLFDNSIFFFYMFSL